MNTNYVVDSRLAEEPDLSLRCLLQFVFGAAEDEVGTQSCLAEELHGVLSGFCFLLSHDSHDGHKRELHQAEVLQPDTVRKLLQSLKVHRGLDVSNRASNLDQTNVRWALLVVNRPQGNVANPFLNCICDMGHDLHCLAEIISLPLPSDDPLIYFARGDVVIPGECDVEKPLVVAQIQVGLSPVLQDEHLSVLVGGHRSCIYVKIGVDFDGRDPESA
mmetsp:Transcript_42885/g.84585  ORF Transcript_42885/g.84585 Transcript_42885/m.84585 type:complete len:217 (-) Transcript_42885:340-990(-)